MRLKCQNNCATFCIIYYPKVPKRIVRSSKVKKLENLSSHFFDPSKKQPDHLRHNVTFGSFSELNSLSCFWTFLKMSKFHFPFGFLEKIWDWKKDTQNTHISPKHYGLLFFRSKKVTFFSHKLTNLEFKNLLYLVNLYVNCRSIFKI